jgi:hypothetical protein
MSSEEGAVDLSAKQRNIKKNIPALILDQSSIAASSERIDGRLDKVDAEKSAARKLASSAIETLGGQSIEGVDALEKPVSLVVSEKLPDSDPSTKGNATRPKKIVTDDKFIENVVSEKLAETDLSVKGMTARADKIIDNVVSEKLAETGVSVKGKTARADKIIDNVVSEKLAETDVSVKGRADKIIDNVVSEKLAETDVSLKGKTARADKIIDNVVSEKLAETGVSVKGKTARADKIIDNVVSEKLAETDVSLKGKTARADKIIDNVVSEKLAEIDVSAKRRVSETGLVPSKSESITAVKSQPPLVLNLSTVKKAVDTLRRNIISSASKARSGGSLKADSTLNDVVAKEEARRRMKAVFTALDQQSNATPLGLVDFDEFRQALHAMNISTVDMDVPLIFANYSDDGSNLKYDLWTDRIGLGRTADELLSCLRGALKGMLDGDPRPSERIVSYFETYRSRGQGPERVRALERRLEGLNGPGSGSPVDSFESAMISINMGLSRVESERLKVALDGDTAHAESAELTQDPSHTYLSEAVIARTILTPQNQETKRSEGKGQGSSSGAEGKDTSFNDRVLSLINSSIPKNVPKKTSEVLPKRGNLDPTRNPGHEEVLSEGMRSGVELRIAFSSSFERAVRAGRVDGVMYLEGLVHRYGLMLDPSTLPVVGGGGGGGEGDREKVGDTQDKAKEQEQDFCVVGRAGIQCAGEELGVRCTDGELQRMFSFLNTAATAATATAADVGKATTLKERRARDPSPMKGAHNGYEEGGEAGIAWLRVKVLYGLFGVEYREEGTEKGGLKGGLKGDTKGQDDVPNLKTNLTKGPGGKKRIEINEIRIQNMDHIPGATYYFKFSQSDPYTVSSQSTNKEKLVQDSRSELDRIDDTSCNIFADCVASSGRQLSTVKPVTIPLIDQNENKSVERIFKIQLFEKFKSEKIKSGPSKKKSESENESENDKSVGKKTGKMLR